MIRLDVDKHGVATLTLARPEKHNALSQAMIDALLARAAEIAGRSDIRVVILTGQGPSFCAGGDLAWMQAQMDGDDAMRRAAATSLARMLGAIDALPQPVIGRIGGNAFGGGVGLACVCDVVIADKAACFGLTETRLGLIPATIGPYVIARMGVARARQVFASGRVFDADEAVRLGIVTRAADGDGLAAAIAEEVAPYLEAAPGAVAAAKAFARSFGPPVAEADITRSINALVTQWQSDEAKEGIRAFFDRRKPAWALKSGG